MQFRKKLVSIITLIIGFGLVNVTIVYGLNYYVRPGDSLYTIAARYGTTISSIMQSNGLWSANITPGQALRVTPKITAPSVSSVYMVRPGDTLYLIAQRFGTTVDALKSANSLSSGYLSVGLQLVIPKTTSGTNLTAGYQVKPGDTLFLIAKWNGIALEDLLRANNLNSGSMIYPGQSLVIPVASNYNSGSGNSNKYNLSQSDIDLLARLVTAESDGEPFEGQVAVAATILNRLNDPRYPKTIPGIIYQVDNGYYQYSPVLDGRIANPAGSSAYQAVTAALSGWDPSKGANGFYNPAKTVNQWVRSQSITTAIGNHVFFNN
jgi:N-acetylmuramoyl-L-alanine amidase